MKKRGSGVRSRAIAPAKLGRLISAPLKPGSPHYIHKENKLLHRNRGRTARNRRARTGRNHRNREVTQLPAPQPDSSARRNGRRNRERHFPDSHQVGRELRSVPPGTPCPAMPTTTVSCGVATTPGAGNWFVRPEDCWAPAGGEGHHRSRPGAPGWSRLTYEPSGRTITAREHAIRHPTSSGKRPGWRPRCGMFTDTMPPLPHCHQHGHAASRRRRRTAPGTSVAAGRWRSGPTLKMGAWPPLTVTAVAAQAVRQRADHVVARNHALQAGRHAGRDDGRDAARGKRPAWKSAPFRKLEAVSSVPAAPPSG